MKAKDSSSLMSSSLWATDQSLDSVGELSDEQQIRLTDVLDRWLMGLEQGTPLAQDKLLSQHPDLAPTLRKYFHSLEDLHEMAAGFGPGKPPATEESKSVQDDKRIGDFELGQELGRGGMGVVYEARQISLNRQVAVKILPFAAVLDSRQIARFKHEAQAAAQLHHPHIVPVFAIGVERGVHYYAMQLINGQSLAQWITERSEQRAKLRSRRLSREHFETVARLGVQAADALQAAHEYGVVHRDIKPSNLLIEANENGGQLWVADFGLARIQNQASLTRTGDLVGTVRYMSPEQANGRRTVVDHRTDIYSLGATLYELATLLPAYREENTASVLRQIETQDPAPPQRLRPEIPADLANIISKAICRSRDDRYATAAEFATDLRSFLNGEPTVARSPSAIEKMSRWGRRRFRVVAGTMGLLLVAVIGLSIAAFLIAREAQRATKNEATARQSARDAREVLDRFGRQLSERLAQIAGAENVRRDLLLDASNYYRRFIADAQHDPEQQTELALAYGRLASLLDEVGAAEESLAAHEQTVKYLELLSHERSTSKLRRQLAVAQNNLALALRRADRLQEAEEQLTQAIGLQESLGASLPGDRQTLSDLATSYSNLGLVRQTAGNHAAAVNSYQAAIRRLESISSADSDKLDIDRRLATAFNNLAGAYAVDQPSRALEFHQRALELQEAILRQQPGEKNVQWELGLTHFNLGALHSRLQQYTSAADNYSQAIEIQAALVTAVPAQQSYRRQLAVSYNNRGLVFTRLKQPTQAIECFANAATLQRQLLFIAPGDAELHSSLGSTLSNLSVAHSRGANQEAARQALQQAIAEQQQALALAPESERFQQLLTKHQSLLTSLTQQTVNRDAGSQILGSQP